MQIGVAAPEFLPAITTEMLDAQDTGVSFPILPAQRGQKAPERGWPPLSYHDSDSAGYWAVGKPAIIAPLSDMKVKNDPAKEGKARHRQGSQIETVLAPLMTDTRISVGMCRFFFILPSCITLIPVGQMF